MRLTAGETVGGGTLDTPAVGPAPSVAAVGTGYTLVKNWHFGTSGTIMNIDQMNAEFKYLDPFNTFNNGSGQYGSNTALRQYINRQPAVAPYEYLHPQYSDPTVKTYQPIEFSQTSTSTRQFMADSLRTYLAPYTGVTSFTPSDYKVACGSSVSKWVLPKGGAFLNQDIVWETRALRDAETLLVRTVDRRRQMEHRGRDGRGRELWLEPPRQQQ